MSLLLGFCLVQAADTFLKPKKVSKKGLLKKGDCALLGLSLFLDIVLARITISNLSHRTA
jgi:hypothetical protein